MPDAMHRIAASGIPPDESSSSPEQPRLSHNYPPPPPLRCSKNPPAPLPLPCMLPVHPQPPRDPESSVFKPEPMLHLNGQAMQHLSILKEMRSKVGMKRSQTTCRKTCLERQPSTSLARLRVFPTQVAQTLRHRISRRVATGKLSQEASSALLKACLSRLAKPVSIALQR